MGRASSRAQAASMKRWQGPLDDRQRPATRPPL